MTHRTRFFLGMALLLSIVMASGCGEPGDIDPTPMLSDLSCQLSLANGGLEYVGEFSFYYLDEDEDLDRRGAQIEWWVDDIEQSPLSIPDDLGMDGVLTLSLAGFPRYEELEVRLQLRDGAQNVSNELIAILETLPGREFCGPFTTSE